jgi:hypothetical protein
LNPQYSFSLSLVIALRVLALQILVYDPLHVSLIYREQYI